MSHLPLVRKVHPMLKHLSDSDEETVCSSDGETWPCEVKQMEAKHRAVLEENERLRAALEWLGDWADTDPDAPGILSASEVAVKALKGEA